MPEGERLDVLLVATGLAPSRTKARENIVAGRVFVNGVVVRKVAQVIARGSRVDLREPPRFVSRGGDKLDGALSALGIDVFGATCVDIGASTGGFTDCVLQRGARHVFAVDVGHGQIDERLRHDARVTVREGVNARYLVSGDFDRSIDFVFVDVSFISLDKLLPSLRSILPENGQLVALVKPQFEVGPDAARRAQGVIRNDDQRRTAIDAACGTIESFGFTLLGTCDSSLPGPKGNREHFAWALRHGGPDSSQQRAVEK